MSRGILGVYIATLAFFVLTWTVVPMIPRYVTELGGDPLTVGYVMSAAPLVTAITRVPLSVVSELHSRVFMMRLGMGLLGVSYLMLYISTEVSLALAGRLIQGLSMASFIPPSIAYVAEVARRGAVGRALGTRALMASLGYTVGPFLGGLISERLGYRALFLAASLSAIAASLAVRLDDGGGGRHELKEVVVEITRIARQRRFMTVFTSTALQTVILASVIPFLSSYMKVKGCSDYEAGIVSSAYGAAGLFSRLVVGFFTDKSLLPLAMIGLGADAIGVILLSYYPLPPHSVVPVLLVGFGDGLFVPVAQALVFTNTRTELRCAASGLYATSWDIGMLVGPVVAGYSISLTGDHLLTFRLLSVFTVLSATVLALGTAAPLKHLRRLSPSAGVAVGARA